MITWADIRTELGWSDDMIHALLQTPDSTNARRCKNTGEYTYGLYKRERVLAAAQTTEGQAAKRRWDEMLRGNTPNPGWTTRLGHIGQALGITAVAVGKLLERLGYRFEKHVTDSAVAAGCGVRRWDGYAMHDDWHLERVVSAIRSAAQVPGDPEVADALAAAIAKQEERERALGRKRKQEETEAARRQEEEAVVSGLEIELRELRAADPGMTLLNAVEYVTPDPAHRIALYRRRSPEDWSIGAEPNYPRVVAKDLSLLERRAKAEGFQVKPRDEMLTSAWEGLRGPRPRSVHLTRPSQQRRPQEPY